MLPVSVHEGTLEAHGGAEQPGIAQGAAAHGAQRGNAAAEDGGGAVPHVQDGGRLHGRRSIPPCGVSVVRSVG